MEVNHVCEFCNKSFSNKYCLKTHLKIHDERERNFQCECGKQFLKEIHLRNHKLTIHSGNNKNFICDICSKAFKSSNNLRTHEAVHSERAYLCRYCEKTFLRLQDVRIHEKTHKKLREFHCMEKSCNKTFNQQSNLLSHIKTVSPQTTKKSHLQFMQEILQASKTLKLSHGKSSWS
ncbi:CLUMA_CG017852, isoform A [Clunio marinus]|uniref:CLUMA_CG017852, isoform A n=1 Tax=Clunio marinus TaxID=568069 RepID=A0A1J1IZ20_9DIPT|nr:CLUMA_CG017852, isoform A [Clunio marinus]